MRICQRLLKVAFTSTCVRGCPAARLNAQRPCFLSLSSSARSPRVSSSFPPACRCLFKVRTPSNGGGSVIEGLTSVPMREMAECEVLLAQILKYLGAIESSAHTVFSLELYQVLQNG